MKAAFVLFVLPLLDLQAQKAAGWSEYLGGPDSSHYSPLKQVNKDNVNKLEVAWSYETGDELSYTFCPLVVDNIAYVAARQGALVALDAATGKPLWEHTFPGGGRFSGIGGQRGANYWESKDRSDRRIFVTSGGMLHAIDARTGKLIDSFAEHGKLDLKTGIDRARVAAGIQKPRTHFRKPDHPGQRHGRRLPAAAGRHTRFRCPHRQAGLDLPHDSPRGRVWIRHVAEGCLQLHGRRRCVGRNHGG